MEWIQTFIDLVLHVDKHLDSLISQFGVWFYVLMFLVIFCETGLIVTPFLPGDSLLFALGAFAARGSLNLWPLLVFLPIAAILGDMVNYWCGVWLGPKIFRGDKIRFLKKEHLDRTHAFYEKYGAKTIVLARFVPIVRTFAPFVAGMGRMGYAKFSLYNVLGALLWVGLFVPAGYFFADHPFVRKNFTLVMLAIIVLSVLPAVFEFLRERAKSRRASSRTP
ncbi:MAG: DedA family protein [Verrucomicrobiales bacterium]|nr:DedA family protein [Verrucomicrobiales bacterium]